VSLIIMTISALLLVSLFVAFVCWFFVCRKIKVSIRDSDDDSKKEKFIDNVQRKRIDSDTDPENETNQNPPMQYMELTRRPRGSIVSSLHSIPTVIQYQDPTPIQFQESSWNLFIDQHYKNKAAGTITDGQQWDKIRNAVLVTAGHQSSESDSSSLMQVTGAPYQYGSNQTNPGSNPKLLWSAISRASDPDEYDSSHNSISRTVDSLEVIEEPSQSPPPINFEQEGRSRRAFDIDQHSLSNSISPLEHHNRVPTAQHLLPEQQSDFSGSSGEFFAEEREDTGSKHEDDENTGSQQDDSASDSSASRHYPEGLNMQEDYRRPNVEAPRANLEMIFSGLSGSRDLQHVESQPANSNEISSLSEASNHNAYRNDDSVGKVEDDNFRPLQRSIDLESPWERGEVADEVTHNDYVFERVPVSEMHVRWGFQV